VRLTWRAIDLIVLESEQTNVVLGTRQLGSPLPARSSLRKVACVDAYVRGYYYVAFSPPAGPSHHHFEPVCSPSTGGCRVLQCFLSELFSLGRLLIDSPIDKIQIRWRRSRTTTTANIITKLVPQYKCLDQIRYNLLNYTSNHVRKNIVLK
jgi:hypothetical protein